MDQARLAVFQKRWDQWQGEVAAAYAMASQCIAAIQKQSQPQKPKAKAAKPKAKPEGKPASAGKPADTVA